MRKIILAAALAAGSVVPCFADGAPDGAYEPAGDAGHSGIYATLRAGAVFLDEEDIPGFAEFNTGFGILASGGYAFGSGFAGEIEFGYRHLTVDGVFDGTVNMYDFMANALYEYPIGPVQPYIGGGVGLGIVEVESDGLGGEESDEGFAWQAIGGVAVPVSDRMDVVVDYRYLSIEVEDEDVASHNVTGGVRVAF